jgi:hypothetical protein
MIVPDSGEVETRLGEPEQHKRPGEQADDEEATSKAIQAARKAHT